MSEQDKIFEAIKKQDLKEIKKLIKGGININIENNEGESPILLAIKSQNLLMVKTLIELGADLNKFNKKIILRGSLAGIEIFTLILESMKTIELPNGLYPWPPNDLMADILNIFSYKSYVAKYQNSIFDILYKNREKFLNHEKAIKIFLSKGRLQEAIEIYNKNSNLTFEDKFLKYKINFLVNQKVVNSLDNKLLLKKENIEWIKSKIVIESKQLLETKNKDELDKVISDQLRSLKNLPELKEILDFTAIEAINNKKFYIAFSDLNAVGGGLLDFFDRGWLTLSIEHININYRQIEDYGPILIHELWHMAMLTIYKNNGNPYKISDSKTKELYNQAIIKSVENIYHNIEDSKINYYYLDALFNYFVKPNFETDSSYSIGTKIWYVLYYEFFKTGCQTIMNAGHEKLRDQYFNKMDLLALYDTFVSVYLYNKDQEHVEFIVRYEELIATSSSLENKLIVKKALEPLGNFINAYTKPAIQKYIQEHDTSLIYDEQSYYDHVIKLGGDILNKLCFFC